VALRGLSADVLTQCSVELCRDSSLGLNLLSSTMLCLHGYTLAIAELKSTGVATC